MRERSSSELTSCWDPVSRSSVLGVEKERCEAFCYGMFNAVARSSERERRGSGRSEASNRLLIMSCCNISSFF